ncbi:MAG: hypothetical protein VW202_12955 [Halieaceae bacterium]
MELLTVIRSALVQAVATLVLGMSLGSQALAQNVPTDLLGLSIEE